MVHSPYCVAYRSLQAAPLLGRRSTRALTQRAMLQAYRVLAQQQLQALPAITSLLQQQLRGAATGSKTEPAASSKTELAVTKEIPTTIAGGQAFGNDLRSISGLGLGDGIKNHTDKWLPAGLKSPMQWIQEAEPILVEGPVVASYGSEDPALGCPVEYINLKGSSKEKPAVCKYTGNRYYSLPHTWNKH